MDSRAALDIAKKHAVKQADAVGQNYYRTLNIVKDIDLTVSGWTGSYVTLAQDGTGLKLTQTGGGSRDGKASNDLSASPIDVSGCHWAVEMTVPAGAGASAYTNIDQVHIELVDVNEVSNRWKLLVNATYNLYVGKVVADVTPSICYTGAPTVDFTQIKTVRLVLSIDNPFTATPSITFNRVVFYRKPAAKGLVVFGFDGAYASQLQATSYLQQLGMKGVLFVGGVLVDIADGVNRMTLAQVKAAHAQGHLIANYAETETSGYWYENNIAGKIAAVTENGAWLKTNGFSDGAQYVSVPGAGRAEDENILWDNDYVRVITGRMHPSGILRPSSFYTYPCPYAVGPGSANTARITAVDAAAADSSVCVFIFHQCTGQSEDISFADFKAIVDYVKTKVDAGLIDVVTPDQIPRYIVQKRAWPPH